MFMVIRGGVIFTCHDRLSGVHMSERSRMAEPLHRGQSLCCNGALSHVTGEYSGTLVTAERSANDYQEVNLCNGEVE